MGLTILYSFWRSSCTWRVRIALNLKDIPYEIRTVSLVSKGGEHMNELKKINPMEQIPALHIDGVTLIESLNIMHYLEETRPQIPLMPKDFKSRAKVREISEIITSGIQPYQNLILLNQFPKEKQNDWARQWIKRGFNAIEKLLSLSARNYCVGDKITIADCCLIPQVYHARDRFKIDLTNYPNILRIDETLMNHPAFIKAHANNQSDNPQGSS